MCEKRMNSSVILQTKNRSVTNVALLLTMTFDSLSYGSSDQLR